LGEPCADPLDEGRERLAAVRRRGRVAEPLGERIRFALGDVLRGETAPTPIIAVSEGGFDFRVETERRGRLARAGAVST
jgi:hypothetical protein